MSDPADTKSRILAAAEELFAEQGFASTSLREITGRAGANLAAVNYHFGSKEDLIRAIFARRLVPLGELRLARLAEIENDAGNGPPCLEDIVEAFVGPPFRFLADDEHARACFPRIFGRMTIEPTDFLAGLFREHILETALRFHAVLARALPGVDDEEITWRLMFMVGVMAHTMAAESKMRKISPFQLNSSDTEMQIRRMVSFIVGGMRAPVSEDLESLPATEDHKS